MVLLLDPHQPTPIVEILSELLLIDVTDYWVKKEELAVYIKFRAIQKRDPGSKLAKYVEKKPSTGPIREITKE